MATFQEARDALLRSVRKVFPDAKPVPRWAGVEAWGAPRPEEVVDHDAPGTYDPKVTVIGIADRKSGPVVYFLDPGDYFALDTHKALLEGAGFKLGRGCIMHARKVPLPTEALEDLFRRVKERDALQAAAGPKPPAPRRSPAPATKPQGPRKAPAKAATAKRSSAPEAETGTGTAAVDAYLAALPEAHRAALERLRKQIHAAAPGATEKIGYGIPTFVHAGSNLVHMAAFRNHLSFFPGSGGVTAAIESDLKGYKLAKGTIQFTPEKPIPAALVKKIVKLRVKENEERAAKKGAARKAPARKPAAKKTAARTPRKA